MSGSQLDVLERRLAGEFRRYHVDAQIRRFVGVFAATLALQLKDGVHDWTWKGLWSLLAAVAVAAARQWWKTAPQQLVMDQVAEQQGLERQAARVSPPPAATDPAP